jgi:hypothetical protein
MDDLGGLVLQQKIGDRLGRQAIVFSHCVESETIKGGEIYPCHLSLIVHEETLNLRCVGSCSQIVDSES